MPGVSVDVIQIPFVGLPGQLTPRDFPAEIVAVAHCFHGGIGGVGGVHNLGPFGDISNRIEGFLVDISIDALDWHLRPVDVGVRLTLASG
jgi:hypothetical protein